MKNKYLSNLTIAGFMALDRTDYENKKARQTVGLIQNYLKELDTVMPDCPLAAVEPTPPVKAVEVKAPPVKPAPTASLASESKRSDDTVYLSKSEKKRVKAQKGKSYNGEDNE